jgi:hypothetical protein
MNVLRSLAVAVLFVGPVCNLAQTQTAPPTDANTGRPLTDDDIAVLRQDVQADKTEIIGRNMEFTDEQSKAFWPVYREYALEQQKVGDQRVALIKDYAANYGKIDDAQADDFIKRAVKFDEDSASLRKKYIPKFKKAIGAKQTAKFLQVENRLDLLVRVQLAGLMPLIK